MSVEVCDADGEAGDRADARGFAGEAGAQAGVEDEASVELVGDDAEGEHRAGLRVVARRAADFALNAEALGDVAGGCEGGLRARSVARVRSASGEQVDGVEVKVGLADVFADEREQEVVEAACAETTLGARRGELDVVSDGDAGARAGRVLQDGLDAELRVARARRARAVGRLRERRIAVELKQQAAADGEAKGERGVHFGRAAGRAPVAVEAVFELEHAGALKLGGVRGGRAGRDDEVRLVVFVGLRRRRRRLRARDARERRGEEAEREQAEKFFSHLVGFS